MTLMELTVPSYIIDVIYLTAPILELWYPEKVAEIKGICKAADIDWEPILLANYIYEYGAHCTSIVAK